MLLVGRQVLASHSWPEPIPDLAKSGLQWARCPSLALHDCLIPDCGGFQRQLPALFNCLKLLRALNEGADSLGADNILITQVSGRLHTRLISRAPPRLL